MNLLAFGSRGEYVQKTQAALNEEGTSRFPALTEDGIFGSKTSARVMEFQKTKHLAVDGQVGPQTRSALQQWLDFVEKHWVNVIKPETEAAARQRIQTIARRYHTELGWHPGLKLGSPQSFFRIAANRSSDGWLPDPPDFGSDQDRRARQGGVPLSTIFRIAWPGGPGGFKTHEISTRAIRNYSLGDPGRNIWDIPSWCGVFAIYVYRSAGLKVEWPNLSGSFRGVVGRPPKKGDYGNLRAQNHFFIITDVKGDQLETVEGNMTSTIGGLSVQTIVKRTNRRISSIRANKANPGFFEPNWKNVI